MGIARQTAIAIIGAIKSEPIHGRVLMCGRQSVLFTPAEAADLIRSYGLVPQISVDECELDRETRLGGEAQPQRVGQAISDRSFFKMLGIESVEFLDHSDYEGAETIIDLNEPLPVSLESQYGLIIDGGTLDNVFNPAQAMMNISRMLKPEGRLLTYNLYSNHYQPYTMLPQQWYVDYFAINRYAFAQVYFCVHEFSGRMSVYQVNLAKRASSGRPTIGNFPIVDSTVTIGSVVYAVKASDSTWARQPSQEFYRTESEWQEIQPIFERFAAYPIQTPILHSTGTMPIVMPGGDDFEYVDTDGKTVTETSRHIHDQQLRRNILSAMRQLSAATGEQPWGIVEVEKIFYDLLNESAEARMIVAKPNVFLFDMRMVNDSVTVNEISKEIYPATAALLFEIPMLVICNEPQIEATWKRISRLFRHLQLLSGSQSQRTDEPSSLKVHWGGGNLVNYYHCGISLSPALDNGVYKGAPQLHAEKIEQLFAAMRFLGNYPADRVRASASQSLRPRLAERLLRHFSSHRRANRR